MRSFLDDQQHLLKFLFQTFWVILLTVSQTPAVVTNEHFGCNSTDGLIFVVLWNIPNIIRWTNEKPSQWGLSCAISGSPFIRDVSDWLTDIPTIFAHVFPLFSTPAALILSRQHLQRRFLKSSLLCPENQRDYQNHGFSPIPVTEIQMIG